MEKEELTEQQNKQMAKVMIVTTFALFILSVINFIVADLIKFKFIPFPDGVILICGLVLVIRSAWLLKLDITRKYHSQIKTNMLFMAFIFILAGLVGYYTKNLDQVMVGDSLNRNFTIALGATLLICGMWIESYTGSRALKRDKGGR